MIIRTLVENTSISKDLRSEHGLSLYIETKKHRLLFDLGASTLFIENAAKLGVDLSKIDLVIVSHGHYDHGGGLKAFLNENSKANIVLNQKAFGQYYAKKLGKENAYIGLDAALLPNDRFVFSQNRLVIDDELEVFSNIKGKKLLPVGNKDLLKKSGISFDEDDFAHEQNLIIRENGKTLLVAGCAHNGIVNIMEHILKEEKTPIDFVIGGFHLVNPAAKRNEDPALINQIGEYLKATKITYYTCHCTGIEPYKQLKGIMQDNIHYLATGSEIII